MANIYRYKAPTKRKKLTAKLILTVLAAILVVVALSSCSVITDVHHVHRGLNLTEDHTGADHQIVPVTVKEIKF